MSKPLLTLSFAALAALSAVPAAALLSSDHNALSRGPVMADGFAKPLSEADRVRAMKDSLERLGPPAANVRRSASKVAPDGTPLPSIVASVYNYSDNSIGMFALPDVSGGNLVKVSDVSSYYGGTLAGEVFYACHDGRFEDYWNTDSDPHGHRIQGYDISTWQPVGQEIYLSDYRASDLAINPVDGLGYAFCDYGAMMYRPYSIDLSTGEQSCLSTNIFINDYCRALAFDEEGTLYGVTRDGDFGIVELPSGKLSKIASLGVSGDSQHGWSATFDPDTHNFLFLFNGNVSGNEVSRLYSVNPASGEATTLAEFPGVCITSMYMAPQTVDAKAPAAPDNLAADFPGGSLSGTISFSMPSTLFDGSPANGSASWSVADGTEVIAVGSAAYGAAVSAPVSVSEGGKHSFSVMASNAAGDGKKARLSVWAGPDIPLAPDDVEVVFNEDTNRFDISWSPVTEGANGGFVNPADIVYSVRRLPADVEVAAGLSSTSFSLEYVPEGIEAVSFAVTASAGNLVSEVAISDPIVTGALQLPYSLASQDPYNLLENWTVIDSNEDEFTWDSDYSNKIYYRYHSTNVADDWAITPPIKAFAGCRYKVNATFKCRLASCPEKVEVKAGYAPTAEAMTMELLPVTTIDNTSGMSFDMEVTPDQDGKLFIGFHALSDPDEYYLSLIALTIEAPVNEAAPEAPVISELKADPSGALKVSGKLELPSKALDGSSLAGIEKVEVRRNGVVATTIEKPTPGAVVDFSDETLDAAGEYAYQAVAVNGELSGNLSEEVKTYVGINRPGVVSDIVISRSADNPSVVNVSWTAPQTDWLGYPLNGDISYTVEVYPDNAYYHGNKSYSDISDNSFSFTPTFDSGLDYGFVYVKVGAFTSAGGGYAEKSDNIYAGAPLSVPFKESFPNYALEHPWGDGHSNGPQIASITDDERSLAFQQYNGWNRLMDSSFQSAEGSQDHDNGFAGMFGWSYVEDEEGNYHNEWTELLSPAIDLSGVDYPMLSFYTYNWLINGVPDMNTLEVDVLTADGARHNALNLVISSLGNVQGWEHVAVDLKDFAGQTVSLIFKGTIHAVGDAGYNWILIDNVRIDRLAAVDLGIADIEAPVQANPNEAFSIKAKVTNLGGATVQSHKATLYHNGSEVESKELGSLAFSASEVVEFSHALSVQDPIGNAFNIEIYAEGDEVAENNRTADVTVARYLQLLPEPEKVYINPGGTRLEWQEPDFSSAVPAAVLEDFESYPVEEQETFLTDAGDWIFIDVDGKPIGGMISSSTWEMIEFPGIPVHSAQSWWVQSRLFEEFSDTYYGHDYSLQYLANMYVVNDSFTKGEAQDDWAISPELCGREQLVTLWAKSYNRDTPESVEFLYSDGSTSPADFKLIRRVDELPGDWTQYALVVPEGGRRFAIRGCSYAPMGTAQTFIDDFFFYPASGESQNLKLKGYNIYCDNALLNDKPLNSLECLSLPSGVHDYAVSAVYESGESRAVKAVEGSGINGLGNSSLKISTAGGVISVIGLDGRACSIVSASGMVIASCKDSDSLSTPAAHGVYTVVVDGKPYKLFVK